MVELKEIKSEHLELFEKIRLKYHRGILTFLLQDKSLKREDREDIAQEVLIKIYRNIHSLDGNRDPGPWIYTISRRCAIDFKKNKVTKIQLCEFDESSSPPSKLSGPEENLLERDELARLDVIMKGFSLRSRQLLFLTYWEGMTSKQVGEAMGMPTGTVKYELHRLRKKIRRLWDER